jgi:hypothetical protein
MSFPRNILAMALAVALIILTLCGAAYFLIFRAPVTAADRSYQLAKNIAADVAKAFNLTPQISIGNTVVFGKSSPLLELATVQREFVHRHEQTETWAGSTKSIHLEGVYLAKAGYNLSEQFAIQIDPATQMVTASLPEPRILSLELKSYTVVKDESGYWNWVTPKDREKALNAMQEAARKAAADEELLAQARKSLEEQLAEIVRRNGGRFNPPARD